MKKDLKPELQDAKEAAIYAGIKMGYALMRRDLQMIAVDGQLKEFVLSTSTSYDTLWEDAHEALLKLSE